MDHQGMGRPSYHHQGQECCISSKLDGTENVIVWEDYVKTRDPAAVADDDSDDKVHYSEEDALILQKFCSEGESHTGDTNLWTATRAVANWSGFLISNDCCPIYIHLWNLFHFYYIF